MNLFTASKKLFNPVLLITTIFILSNQVILAAPVEIGKEFITGEDRPGIQSSPQFNSIGVLLSKLLPNVFVIAGIIIFFFILLGGFTMITSAGNPDKQKEGSQMITGAVMGFAVIFGAYWIVQLLELILGVNILNPGGGI